ncbi:MAG: LysM peptidoglycan-binding domain-containing protein [Clostridia bacterium]|nr:LysM peptidoglycan-binding domain-containing protein [Clostridia bacterium]
MTKLKPLIKKYYKVKEGQTLRQIAEAFSVSAYLLARENGLTEEVQPGQILFIPPERGNAYRACATDTKPLLCGSVENYEKRNGGGVLYPGMLVIL